MPNLASVSEQPMGALNSHKLPHTINKWLRIFAPRIMNACLRNTMSPYNPCIRHLRPRYATVFVRPSCHCTLCTRQWLLRRVTSRGIGILVLLSFRAVLDSIHSCCVGHGWLGWYCLLGGMGYALDLTGSVFPKPLKLHERWRGLLWLTYSLGHMGTESLIGNTISPVW